MSQEVKLFSTTREREYYDNLADIYAILVCTEHLEKAYIKDTVTAQEYTAACDKLIVQFRVATALLQDQNQDIETLMKEYSLSCPAAIHRLLTIGMPATMEHALAGGRGDKDGKPSAQHVAECVQHFITLMDSLKLHLVAVDQVHPLLNDMLITLNQFSGTAFDESKAKVKSWLMKLNKMKASVELQEDEVRQLLFDLESAHNSFYRALSQH
jgi:ESCRT-I complex subunit VPS28